MKTLLLATSCVVLAAMPSHAARLFTSGFETNDFTATEWTSTSGSTVSIQTSTVRSGTYALRLNASASQPFVQRDLPADDTGGTYSFRFLFRVAALPGAKTRFFSFRASGGTRSFSLNLNTSGTVEMIVTDNTTATSSSALSAGAWNVLEVQVVLHDSTGSATLRINGVQEAQITNKDTLPTNVRNWALGVTDGVNSTLDMFFDDLAVNDEVGTFQTSWMGDGKIALRKPASDDTVTWTKTGANCSGTNNTDCVDDEPGVPDDASGYNSTSSVQTDRFNSSAMPAEVPSEANIILVDVYARLGGSSTSGTNTARMLLWDQAGSQTQGPTFAGCDTTTWTFMTTAQHLVFDAGSRTKADLDDPDFDLGVEPVSLSQTCRATAIWANVEWIEAPAAPSTSPPQRMVQWE